MDWKTILIIALFIFLWYSYHNPTEGKALIDKGIDQTQALIGKAQGFATTCPEDYDPVCADGTTYDNACLAQKAGHNEMTAGVC